ncbi:hypothetical protein HanRHA438_Chr12g0574661 [Helianthus annuus]|nr:hypothetical protein HanRHA438_Chr12g0574661 [Helianthus annuus]
MIGEFDVRFRKLNVQSLATKFSANLKRQPYCSSSSIHACVKSNQSCFRTTKPTGKNNHNELPIEPVSRNLRVGTLAASVSHSDLKNMFEIHRCVSIIVLFVAELRVCVLEECGGCNEGEE